MRKLAPGGLRATAVASYQQRAPSFTRGTSHYEHAGSPGDPARASEYEMCPYAGLPGQVLKGMATLEPPDADVTAVADAIVLLTPLGAPRV